MSVAIVGLFQQGKSTLVNCLCRENKVEMGNGWKSETSQNSAAIVVSDSLEVIDTPGMDDTQERTEEARKAIEIADSVLVMLDNEKALGEKDLAVMKCAVELHRRLILLCNCKNASPPAWKPLSAENRAYCERLGEQIALEGWEASVLPVDGRKVFPVNLQWARYGLGLLEATNEDFEVLADRFRGGRKEALGESQFLPLDRFLRALPLEVLKAIAAHPDQEVERVGRRFADLFGQRMKAEAM